MPGSECSMAGFQCLTDIPDNSGSPDLADFPNVRLSAAVSMTLVREDMSLKETFTKPEKPSAPHHGQHKIN